jgi:hypothetical protein
VPSQSRAGIGDFDPIRLWELQLGQVQARFDPTHRYRLGLNSLKHINFQSKWGVPLAPIVYEFRTRD